ncbi:MAG: hypothetical protein Q9178_007895 [Gyalolechia marmorata]
MTASEPGQTRRKTAKRPPSYYKNLRQELAAKGRTAPKHADNTKKIKASLLKKWSRLLKKRAVSTVDDLYHILFYYWMHNQVVYRDEQQRNYVSTGILMASYFGCRPVSMFDTRLRVEDDDGARKSVDHVTAVGKLNNVGEDQEVLGSENNMDANDDASTYCDSDSDSGTDDGVDAGLDETGKTFIVEREENPILCLLDHLLSMALYDDVFAAESLRNVSNIFRAKVPSGKKCLQLKTKRRVPDTPVFREPERAEDGYRTSPTEPLRSGTWLRYLRRLGRNSGLEQSFTQYCARRGLVNAVNNKAPSSVRDQIFDNQSNAVYYYLDREVRFNTQAAFLGRPSDDVKLANSKRVVQLGRTSKDLTEKLRKKHRLVRLAPPVDPLLEAKKQVDAALHREKTNRRNRMLGKARKRHFRIADTATLKA